MVPQVHARELAALEHTLAALFDDVQHNGNEAVTAYRVSLWSARTAVQLAAAALRRL
jgi:hypothetical protein